MNEFILNDYRERKTGMACMSRYEIESFLEFLHGAGRKWNGGESYRSFIPSEDERIIYFNEGLHGSINSHDSYAEGAPLLNFSDFDVFVVDSSDFEEAPPEEDTKSFNDFISSFVKVRA